MTRLRISLPSLITAATLALVIAVSVAVGLSGFRGAQRSVDELWRELADSLARQTTAETLRLIEGAEPHTTISAQLVASGVLSMAQRDAFLEYLTQTAEAYEDFTWVYYGQESDGAFLGVFRGEPGAPVERKVRWQLGEGQARQLDLRQGPGGAWEEVGRVDEPFDPRTRPWYVEAAGRPVGEGVWTDPYLFHGSNEPGVTYARPVHDPESGSLVGVFGIDFEMAPLSQFLSQLDVAREGRAFVVTRGGLVIGDPEGRLVHETADGWAFWRGQEHPDAMLSGAWRALTDLEDPWAPFGFAIPATDAHDGEMLAVARPFPADTEIPWLVITVVPRDALLGHAERQGLQAALIALCALGLAVVGGALLSRLIGRQVARLRQELLDVARFDLDARPDTDLRSVIRELDEMGQATAVMKQGLRSFSRYVPHQLVRQVLGSGRDAALGAENRELTVLFSDIEGFTSVVESTPPDALLAALGEYLHGMNEAISGEQGTVAQYLGDGIMAFWGAPEELSEHAAAACRGALAMQACARALQARAEASGGPVFKTRIGLDTGEVMVGNIGAPERFNYGILGDTVNTAARLENLNKLYRTSLIAGERAQALARHAVLFRPLDQVLLRGKRKPMVVYEVVGLREELDDERLSFVAAYTSALEIYLEGRFEEAHVAFSALVARNPHDHPCRLLMERCARFVDEPPGPDWKGVLVLDADPA